MAEANGNQNAGQGNNGGAGESKTFTQEQLDAIVAERLSRQKKQYEGFEDYKAKAEKYDEQQQAGKSEIQKLQESNQALLDKMAGMEKQAKIEKARTKVSTDTGVPVDLLTGEDEESCKQQAEAILNFAKGKKYPGVKGNNHESSNSSKHSSSAGGPSEDDFRELAGQIFGRKD